MGPCARRPHDSPLAGSLLCGLVLSGAPKVCAQVFTVGMKTATADVTTEFHPTRVELPKEPLDEKGRQELIRNLESEQGFAHRELPLGAGLQLVANGTMTPRDDEYKKMLYEKGQSAAAGDRVQVTALQFQPGPHHHRPQRRTVCEAPLPEPHLIERYAARAAGAGCDRVPHYAGL